MRGAFWWVDRWRQSSGYTGLRLEEQGAFRNLCDELWLRDGVLPDDDRILANISGDAVRWPDIRDAVMAKFYRVPGGWRNKTHDSVSEDAKKRAKKQADYRERRKKRNEPGNVTGNEKDNDPSNVPSSPFTVHSSHVIPVPPAREEPETIDAESAALSQSLVEALKRATEITGLSGMEILADAKVRGTGGPITNPLGCSPASRKLWRITVERVGGFVAAWKSDRRGKAAKRVAVPAFDRGSDHAVTEADLAWDPRLGPAPKSPRNEPEPERPALTLTVAPGACPVCGGPVRHSTEGGDTILRCDSEACGWAAVWRSVAA